MVCDARPITEKIRMVVCSVIVSSLPSSDRQAPPLDVPTTVEAVFTMPDQGLHVPLVGERNPLPTKVVPPTRSRH